MFDDITFDTLKAALRGGMARQAAIAQNIANADTPGYRRYDVSFEGALADAIATELAPRGGGAGQAGDEVPALPVAFGGSSSSVGDLQPSISREADTQVRVDGSNFDADREMSELAANQMAYNTVNQMMVSRLEGYRTVLGGQ